MAKAIREADTVIAGRIRHARKLAGVSQEELGDALGLTFQQIQKCEKGVNRVSVGRLVDIARKLKMPVSYFYEGLESDVPQAPPIGDTALTIAREVDRLPQDRREMVGAMIRAMLRVARDGES